MGSVDSSLHVARKVLNCGKSLLVFPGGVAEMMQAVPGKSYNIVAESRKGFIRLAIESGADVVPVFAFGANEFIHSSQNKTLERINTWFAKKFMFFFPVYFGRWKTLVPFKHPINCIVGKPIPVIKSASPSAEQVETVHRQFLKDLKELFETHKTQYGSEHDTLTIN